MNCLKRQKRRKENKLKLNSSWVCYKYFVYRGILVIIAFIFLPILLILSDFGYPIRMALKEKYVIICLSLLLFPLYYILTENYIIQGFWAFYDFFSNNAVTIDMRYIDS